VEVGSEACSDHIDWCFLHSIGYCRVIFEESCLLIILIT
jgi:hypothetical protein